MILFFKYLISFSEKYLKTSLQYLVIIAFYNGTFSFKNPETIWLSDEINHIKLNQHLHVLLFENQNWLHKLNEKYWEIVSNQNYLQLLFIWKKN